MKLRADKLLQQLGYFESRKKAQVAIEKKLVRFVDQRGTHVVSKASDEIDKDKVIKWLISEHPELQFVSRAGYKLQGALDRLQLNVRGLYVLDIGISTGGFTDCLLKNQSLLVVGVDVGREQLHHSLRHHPNLLWYDKINAKEPLPEFILEDFRAKSDKKHFDFIVADVSFISLEAVVLPQLQYLKPGGRVLMLFKPQFEVGRNRIGKKGLVAKEDGLIVLKKAVNTFNNSGLEILDHFPAVIEGEDGNQEYFIFAHSKPSCS